MPIALAFTPEINEPLLANCRGGSVVVSIPGQENRLVINPGTNMNVDEELWASAQELSAIRELLDQRLLEVIDLTEVGDTITTPATSVGSIAKVEKRAAVRLINVSRDAAQLNTWHEADDRMEIRNAIKRRLAELNEGKG